MANIITDPQHIHDLVLQDKKENEQWQNSQACIEHRRSSKSKMKMFYLQKVKESFKRPPGWMYDWNAPLKSFIHSYAYAQSTIVGNLIYLTISFILLYICLKVDESYSFDLGNTFVGRSFAKINFRASTDWSNVFVFRLMNVDVDSDWNRA
jgi:hypothetical protein